MPLTVGEIVKYQQPDVYKKLCKPINHKNRIDLSHREFERMMKDNKGVDERRCR